MPNILVTEDDLNLNQAICYALNKEGYASYPAHSLKEAKAFCQNSNTDLILLDVNLPDGEGFSFCEWMKTNHITPVPILFLTARDLEEDVLKGYELGAEDYVTKPFSIKVLLKKIHVILNRSNNSRHSQFSDGFLTIDFEKAKTEVNGRECMLTPTEFRLLWQLISHSSQLLTYDVLLELVWENDGQFVDKHTLAVNINRLRRKIEDNDHRYISNVYGMGYQWMG